MPASAAAATAAATGGADFVIERVFDAPRELVWRCFTEPDRMKQWWGPKGFSVFASAMDLRVGGFFHYGMTAPDGSVMWGKFVFREIVAPERMVFVNSFSDEAGNVTRHPGHESWPLRMLTVFTFEDIGGGRTRLTTRSAALEATLEERRTFDSNHASMRAGWNGTLDQLTAFIAKAR